MSIRDLIPRPTDPQYIALDECATKWKSVGVCEYSVFILTHAQVLLKKHPSNTTRNTYKA